MNKYNSGITLIELMIAVVILAIIVAIAFPSYQSQMRKNRRTDGQQVLLEVMQAQEKLFSRTSSYTTALNASLTLRFVNAGGETILSEKGFYIVSAQACAGTTINLCVILTATAQGPQVADGNLTIDSRNYKTPAASW